MSFSSPFPQVHVPTTNLYDYLFADLDDQDAERVALVDAKTGAETTFREMVTRVDAFAGALAARGVGVGDVVGLLSPNSSAFAIAFHGILRAGATATTINALNKFAYGANLGWMDWRGDIVNGAVIGE